MNVSTIDPQTIASSLPLQRGPLQITMSPYYGRPDFTGLSGEGKAQRTIDFVSVADILRNAFVFPPHSIFEDVKLVTFGFCPNQDMHVAPVFHFKFRNAGEVPEVAQQDQDWVGVYHRLLCQAVTASCSEMKAPWLL